jgi:hypothetical protein
MIMDKIESERKAAREGNSFHAQFLRMKDQSLDWDWLSFLALEESVQDSLYKSMRPLADNMDLLKKDPENEALFNECVLQMQAFRLVLVQSGVKFGSSTFNDEVNRLLRKKLRELEN